MSYELVCKVIAGALGAGSFTFMAMSNPPAAILEGVDFMIRLTPIGSCL